MSTRIVATALALLLTACGGGGGGGGGGSSQPMPTSSITGSMFAPSTGPGDTQHYFPLAAGDQWFYVTTTNDPSVSTPDGFSVVSVNGTQTIKNVSATVVSSVNPTATAGTSAADNYYYASAGGITYLGNNDAADSVTPLIVPYPQLLFPVTTGPVASIVGTNISLGNDTLGNPLTGNLDDTITNADIESVTVPAGVFADALKQVTSTSVTGTDSVTHTSATVTGTDTVWLVPGIGSVKEVTVINSSPSVTREADLRGYVVDGVGHGLGVPMTIASGTTISSSAGTFSSAPAIATDGTHFLVAVPQVSGSGTGQSLTWVGYVIGPGGAVARSFNLTSALPAPVGGSVHLAALGYDGTNYLFVYQGATVAPTLLAESVSPTGALLAGPNTILNAAGSSPALAFNGTNFLLVFTGSNSVTQTDQVFAEALSPRSAQAIGGGPVPLVANSGSTGYQSGIAVASDAANFLAVWDGCVGAGECGIYASRLDSTGSVLDPAGIAVVAAPAGSNAPSAEAPAVAFDGQNYLVAYVDYRPQGSSMNSNISAARISPAGALLDGTPTAAGIAITTTPGSNSSPVSVASIGGESWVTWSSGSVSAETQVSGARVNTAGQLVNPVPAGIPVLAAPIAGGQMLTVTAGSPGASLLAWLALPFTQPLATPTSSFGTLFMYQ